MCDTRTMQSYRKNLMQYFRSVSIVETEKQRASVSTTTDNANEGEREKKIQRVTQAMWLWFMMSSHFAVLQLIAIQLWPMHERILSST